MKEAHEQSLKRDTKLMTAQQILDNTSPTKSVSPLQSYFLANISGMLCFPAFRSLAVTLVLLSQLPWPLRSLVSKAEERRAKATEDAFTLAPSFTLALPPLFSL